MVLEDAQSACSCCAVISDVHVLKNIQLLLCRIWRCGFARYVKNSRQTFLRCHLDSMLAAWPAASMRLLIAASVSETAED